MALIHSINEHFVILGISEQQMHNSHRFNARILMPFLVFVWCIFSCATYILCEANRSVEIVESLFIASSAFSGAVALTIIILKLEKLYKFFYSFENIVQESEYTSIGNWSPMFSKTFELKNGENRTKVSGIQANSWSNWSKNTKVEQVHQNQCFCCTNVLFVTQNNHQLFRIFYNKFRKWCLSANSFYMVSHNYSFKRPLDKLSPIHFCVS